MLDGLEIFKALTHLLPFEPEKEDQYKPTAEHNQGKTKEQLAAQRKTDETNYYTGKYSITKTIAQIDIHTVLHLDSQIDILRNLPKISTFVSNTYWSTMRRQ